MHLSTWEVELVHVVAGIADSADTVVVVAAAASDDIVMVVVAEGVEVAPSAEDRWNT